jgi:general secretion pathway protein G
MREQKGFTLIELLVVIAIIGLLSTLAVVALNNARQKSRDAKRVGDIKQIQTALEMYYNDVGHYPAHDNTGGDLNIQGLCLSSGNGFNATCAGTTYMASIPSNPTPNGIDYVYNSCNDSGGSFDCAQNDTTTPSNVSSYRLHYQTEGIVNNMDCTGGCYATPAGIH